MSSSPTTSTTIRSILFTRRRRRCVHQTSTPSSADAGYRSGPQCCHCGCRSTHTTICPFYNPATCTWFVVTSGRPKANNPLDLPFLDPLSYIPEGQMAEPSCISYHRPIYRIQQQDFVYHHHSLTPSHAIEDTYNLYIIHDVLHLIPCLRTRCPARPHSPHQIAN
ncbi:hypothetical protein C8F01DRAFT_1141899 [Mycena amicta]|nr:hypothetical protein C8F01DRAFT_1162308 [Mycena amicta]KAJ7060213.1 hypothetical protein C8F01DRAFT_1141899 [Mycena amicta]